MSPNVVLRAPRRDDLDALLSIFEEPPMARWWPRYDRAHVEREMVVGDDDQTTVYVIEVDEHVGGIIQSWEEPDEEYRHAGIDIGVAARWHGTGVALVALRAMATHLFDVRGHHHLTIDPEAANSRAIRCYEKLGYRPVGVLRQNTLSAADTYDDTLLMDMVRADLRLDGPVATIA